MRAWFSWAAGAALLLCFVTGCDSDFMVSRDLGARCERHADCQERCLFDTPSGEHYPDGFCSVSCDSDRDCPTGAACAALQGGVCLFECEATESCSFLGAGWDCLPQSGRELRARDQPHEVRVCLGQ